MSQPDFDMRKNKPDGIRWRGFTYESVPAFGDNYVAVVEDGGDYLVVQRFEHGSNCRYWMKLRDRLIGNPVRVPKIGLGKPTNSRIKLLKDELSARTQPREATG